MADTSEQLPATVNPANADEFTAALQAMGYLNAATGGTEFNRITQKGTTLLFDKQIIASYDLVKKTPALYVQLADAPVEYQSMWFEAPLANAVGRPEVANRFCKSHFEDPAEARKFSESYNGRRQSCDTCPVHPFMPKDQVPPEAKAQQGADRCQWKADIEFQILDRKDDGTFEKTDDTVYTMSLPTTGIIEFKGSGGRRNDPLAGAVSPENFMVQLAKLGVSKWGSEGLLKARTYLGLGGVIAELHLPMASNDDGSRTWHVPSFKPIEIIEVEQHEALPTSEQAADNDGEEPVPF